MPRSSTEACERGLPRMHLPSRREELTAIIADALADLAGVYYGAVAEGDDGLVERLCNLNDRDLGRVACHLQAVVKAIV